MRVAQHVYVRVLHIKRNNTFIIFWTGFISIGYTIKTIPPPTAFRITKHTRLEYLLLHLTYNNLSGEPGTIDGISRRLWSVSCPRNLVVDPLKSCHFWIGITWAFALAISNKQ
ncbi:hypothetical protein K504DRAFT_23596 [Pleomassaria siparia CBS 279.74]|uniref:Uncharacterized protein n=1 Tax=Pleomassaria siparia CBS 279.74 TaxID=1314801 RepID=A0A6G1KR26_9PLEO|nr:hypothetical protein K504DRAFT_23596 [Pleomassaria siparia CBS 279.74]